MRYTLLMLIVLSLSGCGVGWVDSVPDCYYGSSTVVGIDAGFPEGLTLSIGYKRHEGLICQNETNALVTLESEATAGGLNMSQSVAFGAAAMPQSDDININD